MADLHCPNCARRLPATAFELTTLKHKVDIDIDLTASPEREDDLYSFDAEGDFSLTITCMNCVWWAEIDLGVTPPDVTVNLGEGNFDLFKKLILLSDGLNSAGLKIDYTPEYGKV